MKYVALLRGIGPSNPNMHGSKLAGVLEGLGFTNVRSVISSGNVVFESESEDIGYLEASIQAEWPKQLGFNSMTIVRSKAQLESLVAHDPFKGAAHSRQSYLFVTFFKNAPTDISGLQGDLYTDLGINALCSVIDTTASKTPDFMSKLERRFGKDITSRTWLTIQRILAAMER